MILGRHQLGGQGSSAGSQSGGETGGQREEGGAEGEAERQRGAAGRGGRAPRSGGGDGGAAPQLDDQLLAVVAGAPVARLLQGSGRLGQQHRPLARGGEEGEGKVAAGQQDGGGPLALAGPGVRLSCGNERCMWAPRGACWAAGAAARAPRGRVRLATAPAGEAGSRALLGSRGGGVTRTWLASRGSSSVAVVRCGPWVWLQDPCCHPGSCPGTSPAPPQPDPTVPPPGQLAKSSLGLSPSHSTSRLGGARTGPSGRGAGGLTRLGVLGAAPPQAVLQQLVGARRAGACHQAHGGFVQEHLGRCSGDSVKPWGPSCVSQSAQVPLPAAAHLPPDTRSPLHSTPACSPLLFSNP